MPQVSQGQPHGSKEEVHVLRGVSGREGLPLLRDTQPQPHQGVLQVSEPHHVPGAGTGAGEK